MEVNMAFFIAQENAAGQLVSDRWWNLEAAIRVEFGVVVPPGGSRPESIVAVKWDHHEAGVMVFRNPATVVRIKRWLERSLALDSTAN